MKEKCQSCGEVCEGFLYGSELKRGLCKECFTKITGDCWECNGTGKIGVSAISITIYHLCPGCKGTGKR